jgi:L-2-hydroxyglutarate oxidase LhgO
MMGIGIDTSIASANEVNDAIAKQEETVPAKTTKKTTAKKTTKKDPELMSKAISYIKASTDKQKAFDSVVSKYGEELTQKQLDGIKKFV